MAGRRKAWEDLSPAYRARLQRKGITKASHAAGESIKTATGHGAGTPSEQRKLRQRRTRTQQQQIKVGTEFGMKMEAILGGLDALGPTTFDLFLHYKQYLHELWLANHMQKLEVVPTFEEFLESIGKPPNLANTFNDYLDTLPDDEADAFIHYH